MSRKRETTGTTHQANTHRLFGLLNMRRPMGTEPETARRWLSPYKPQVYRDAMGAPMAWGIEVGEESGTLFSAHLDTVHSTTGDRKVRFDAKKGIITSGDGTPLGADDGAGVWLLLEMIDAGVPGFYLFTAGEERGGIGAKFMAANYPEMLGTFRRAVAFDRKGTYSVISHQGWGRCCSDAFAEDLASQLNFLLPDDYAFMCPDDTGVYTDTAEYTDLIPECTNLSCGYAAEHTQMESLDLGFLLVLRDACVALDWESLTTQRDPSVQEIMTYDWPDTKRYTKSWIDEQDLIDMRFKDIINFVEDTPAEEVADLLDSMAMQLCELKQKITLN